ncbi:MAG: YadA C-terminal domain-containing protein, partial [Alphaproteobacteria bacterium]|nr:YadA C-terminal domain-containing protein [Alphaproteobacteria bacterium]
LSALNNSIDRLDEVVSGIEGLSDNVKDALGGEFDEDTGKWSADLTVPTTKPNYGDLTVERVTDALQNIMGNIGKGEALDTITKRTEVAANNGVSSENTVNQNIAALNSTVGDLNKLHGDNRNLSDKNGKLPTTVVAALNNIDATLGTVRGLSDKLKDAGKYKGNLSSSSNATVESHLSALDRAIGDRQSISNTMKINYNESAIQGKDVAVTLSQIASNIGTADDLGKNLINGVSAKNSVNANIAAINNSVGDVSQLSKGIYVAETTNVTDAIMQLDTNMYKLDYAVGNLADKYKKLQSEFRSGMASMAAMSALVPNPRAQGNTSLSIGTGMYKGNGAVAVGGFHNITDNLMLNAGLAWGKEDASYRMGVTYSW